MKRSSFLTLLFGLNSQAQSPRKLHLSSRRPQPGICPLCDTPSTEYSLKLVELNTLDLIECEFCHNAFTRQKKTNS